MVNWFWHEQQFKVDLGLNISIVQNLRLLTMAYFLDNKNKVLMICYIKSMILKNWHSVHLVYIKTCQYNMPWKDEYQIWDHWSWCSCNNITATLIQISHLFFGFFSKTNHQVTILLTPIVSRSKSKCYKAQKIQKCALNSQLQALQILTNDDEVENWRLSNFLLAVRFSSKTTM